MKVLLISVNTTQTPHPVYPLGLDYLAGALTGSATRKPRLVGGDKGRNKQISSLPGSPALWAGSFTLRHDVRILDMNEAGTRPDQLDLRGRRPADGTDRDPDACHSHNGPLWEQLLR